MSHYAHVGVCAHVEPYVVERFSLLKGLRYMLYIWSVFCILYIRSTELVYVDLKSFGKIWVGTHAAPDHTYVLYRTLQQHIISEDLLIKDTQLIPEADSNEETIPPCKRRIALTIRV